MATPILCLAGPTASGKSAAALALAERWPLEIITVDSATIYRGMDIGTAKPSAQERARVAQHLLDIRDPAQSYSAAEFAHDARQLIRDIRARGNIPLLCGGTMLYYKALREGLNNLPLANAAVRAQIDQEAASLGWPGLHRQLAGYDPETAARLSPNDSQRLQRAIEIYRVSGIPMSAWLRKARPSDDAGHRYMTLSLEPSDRLVLHARIAARFGQMMDQGLLAEVAALHARSDLHTGLPSMRCVGYRQLWAHLDGDARLQAAVEQAVAATRQLAKRQLTWLRAQPERVVVDCLAADARDRIIDAAAQVWR
ncbi:tRNA (adenosine(37)-N6)-dimethylallyltransferase MiaA [Allopusillimonas soli]|uniref:tRNA dimethylallyltransferase n=1 Tax=Allopusillimonas soli TaxID=659016 RepID=A0A853FCK9_9BURK|nr:tRNA (adenosine(37)-N6)-dimethylallyltransferase MiaA [Allopusillimonas soli]NYT38535.1 tRNA (adenosine(37)-N6)-dimethylallyltransferase MiaA [Allopusillimonas soli]TEA71747.1 tRNA (adenosine(37)-N6)-dimethylallyltransferase MiaA [Allopusillimonas soli]